MIRFQSRRVFGAALAVSALVVAGCGGDSEKSASTTTEGTASQAQRAAAISLQQAMDSAARSIDGVRGTRSSLERLGASLQPQVAQTSDVIGLLTPKAAETGADQQLLAAAREQRSFLQFAADSTTSRTRSAATNSVTRAREAGRRASEAYSTIAREQAALAGILPASTTFNTGRLRDAVRNVSKASSRKPSSGGSGGTTSSGGTPAPTGSSCGDGLSVNSVTTCPFARNVRDAYQQSGGDSVVEVFSPVTQQTYIMSCSSGVPVVCTGGNGARVTIR